MTNLLRKVFIKDYRNVNDEVVRQKHGKLACFVGICSNTVLFLVKMIAGLLSHSLAIIADSINNLSDMGSSVITLIGFKLSGKPADKEHPYGHERIEYIAGLIVSLIILFVGFELGYNSIKKIINNDSNSSDITLLTIIILSASIIIKLWQSFFNRKIAKTINSVALEATAQDSLNDVISTLIILIGSIVTYFWKDIPFDLDGYLGVCASGFILWTGIGLIKDTTNPLIGVTADSEFVKQIVEEIKSNEKVLGVHDVLCHCYGPTKFFMSLHAEVSSSNDLLYIHDIIDNIEMEISKKYGIELTIHMDPIEDKNEIVIALKHQVKLLLSEINPKLQMHDFRVVKGPTHTNIIFDCIFPKNFKMTENELEGHLESMMPSDETKYNFVLKIDYDYWTNDDES